MVTRADDLIDRRHLRRKLTFWRAAALGIAALALAASAAWSLLGDRAAAARSHIAKVKIEGTIVENEELLRRLDRIRESSSVKGVILVVDSHGGTTAGGEAIYDEVRRLAAEKPVVAQVGTLAASAGYMVASASDHIVARRSSIIGSIGVLIQFPDLTGLMDNLGIKLEAIKSSPLKAEPSPFSATTEEERAMVRALILDSYEWFVGIVSERRPLTPAEARALSDGSIFTGRQALDKKLVDALGGEREAVDWLATKGVDPDLEVVEWKPRNRSPLLLRGLLTRSVAQLLGFDADGGDVLERVGADRLFLDGLLSVWHPEKAVWVD